ncbi:MAG: ATP-binding protein [Nitrospirota bacterium]
MEKNLIKREIFPQIVRHLHKEEVTVITGARQTGKTTLLLQLKDYLIKVKKINSSRIKVFNLDLFSDLEGIRNQTDFIKFLREELNKEKFLYVFIDEIQRLENPGKFLKGIYDLNLPLKLVVTGSSSLEMKSKIFESLTGRKKVFHIWPFSFSEYLSCHDPMLSELIKKRAISTIHKRVIFDHLLDFIIFGGYPRAVLAKSKEEKIQVLNEIYSSYVEKDIVGFIKIKNPLTFSKLVALLSNQVGSLINLKEISNTLGINYRTLEHYLSVLENTFVINITRPFFTNIRKELTKMPKIYFVDNGIRNLAIRYFAKFLDNRDKGELLENFVFSSLLKKGDMIINYWRTKDKSEVDFICRDYYGNTIPLEVKANEFKKPEINKGLRSFIEKYNPAKAFLLNLSLEEKIKFKNTNIEFILPYSIERILIKE